MAGMAALMASTYKAYLGEGLGPLSWITDLKIHHPGRVAGRVRALLLSGRLPAACCSVFVLGRRELCSFLACRAQMLG